MASSGSCSRPIGRPWLPKEVPSSIADELWNRYRQAVIHPYLSALSTAGLGGLQDDGIALEGLRRAVTALEELETVAALRRAG